jgi:hypothetical protein
MADLLERDVIEVEQEGHGRESRDDGVRVLLAEVEGLIADRLGRGEALEREMMMRLDGVPMSVIVEAADVLGVVVTRGVWRFGRRGGG